MSSTPPRTSVERRYSEDQNAQMSAMKLLLSYASNEKDTVASGEGKGSVRNSEEVSNVNPAGDQASEIVNH